jgi:hypothetical protein
MNKIIKNHNLTINKQIMLNRNSCKIIQTKSINNLNKITIKNKYLNQLIQLKIKTKQL